jgi:biotin transporter BioY
MTHAAWADLFEPRARTHALAYNSALILGGSLLLALSAQVAFRIGPVPVSAQTLAAVFVGALLGSRRGAAAVLAYLAEGAAGLPVFAGGAGGLLHMAGPTGGYLVGFLPAAWLTGFLAERGWDRRIETALVAMFLGHVMIYACGLPWLAAFLGVRQALAQGLYVFIWGDLGKIALATALLPGGWRVLGMHDRRG